MYTYIYIYIYIIYIYIYTYTVHIHIYIYIHKIVVARVIVSSSLLRRPICSEGILDTSLFSAASPPRVLLLAECLFERAVRSASSRVVRGKFMYGFYYQFSNLRFGKTQNVNDCSAAHVVVYVVSSEMLKCRLLT